MIINKVTPALFNLFSYDVPRLLEKFAPILHKRKRNNIFEAI